jgi:hypothetical protein
MSTNGSRILYFVAGLSCLAGNLVFAADADIVISPVRRQASLDQAKKLLAVRNVAPVTVDPFHSEKFSEMVAGLNHVPTTNAPTTAVVASPRSQRDVLQAIATSLKPTGNFVLGGQQTLVFGQKRVKAGGSLTITFEGTEYILEITAIERTSFTLRLNREEFTRPIK